MPILLLGVLATSTSAVLVRLAQAEAPSLVIAAGRLVFSALIIAPWTVYRRHDELQALAGNGWRAGVLSGLMLGLHFAAYNAALAYTSITAATVLATSTPIWVGIASPVVLKEPLTRPLQAGIALAVAGSVLIGLDGSAEGSRLLLGNALALGSALTGAVYFLIGRRLRQRISLMSYTSIVYGCGAVALVVLALLSGHRLWGYGAMTVLLVFLMAVGPQLLGHSSYNYALGYLPAAYVAVAIISEPVGATALGAITFGELPGRLTGAGSALILAGVLLASRRRRAVSPSSQLT